MMNLLPSPWVDQFDALLAEARKSLVLCSPYIGREPCDRVAHRVRNDSSPGTFEVFVVTDLSRDNVVSGVTDADALATLVEAVPSATVRFLPSLHAKVYVADYAQAIVTSSNMTTAGLRRNFEYGVRCSELETVRRIRDDVLQYALLGSLVDNAQLKRIAEIATDLREIHVRAQRTVKRSLRLEFDRRLRLAEDEIIRVRSAGRTLHAIFADAIMHVLRQGPLRTADIHLAVRGIHPDLCDDAVDRVIDGRHFGKKWKHAVRTAQQHLKKEGRVRFEQGLWWYVQE